jgi:hypothetical protein
MAITPAGKTRLMVSQVISTPTAPGFNDGEPQLAPEEISPEGMGDDLPDIPEVPEEVPEAPEEGLHGVPDDNKPTLTDYIFKTLEGFGYPGRRLEEFKKKFVKESVSPDGTKDIKVEIPDRHYPDAMGNIKTVETEELGKIVRDINSKFGLNFNGAERSEGKWLINLTSAKKEEEGGDSMVRDNLDEVYGTPSNGNPNVKKEKSISAFSQQSLLKEADVDAYSQREMITSSKDDVLMEQLRKLVEKDNAS